MTAPLPARRLARRLAFLLVLAWLALVAPPALGHDPATPGAETAEAAAPDDTGPVAIPVASIAVQASNLGSLVKRIEESLEAPARQTAIADLLPEAEKDIRARTRRLETLLDQSYDRGELDSAQSTWRSLLTELSRWEATLAGRLESLDERRAELTEQSAIWAKTAQVASEERAPADVREVVSQSQASLRKAERALRRSRDEALGLQRSVVALKTTAQAQLDAIADARENVLRHLLRRNDPLPWEIEASDYEANRASFDVALDVAWKQLNGYLAWQGPRFFLHGLLIVFLMGAAARAGRSLRAQGTPREEIPPALTHPLAAGLVLGTTATVWLHPDAPPQLGQVATLIVLPFWFPVLRSLVPPALKGPVTGFLVLVPLELSRQLLASFDLVARGILILEAAAYFLGIFWLRRPARLHDVPLTESPAWTRALGAWLHYSLLASGIALAGAVAGWTTLGDLALSTVARGSFAAGILFTAVRVAEDVAEGALRAGHLARLRTIDRAPVTFLKVVRRTARAVAALTWAYTFLDYLTIQRSVVNVLRTALATPLGYGNFEVTLGGVVAFGVAIWVSWLLSRFLAALLEGEVFSRVELPRGVPFALSTIGRYVVLVMGFVTAIAALGVEVGNLALLVSALGVGIGFGMQNVVNNFISGLILLFERPIKVGDRISLDALLGEVKQIGIRASIVRTFDGADVIVPNGDLISSQVTNWTLADTRRRITVPVGVTYGTPAREVVELLTNVGRANPDVLQDPEPVALFTGFGDSSLDFELRAWTDSEDALTLVRSALAVAVQDALDEAGIEVPFPQRDLHLKTVPTAPAEED